MKRSLALALPLLLLAGCSSSSTTGTGLATTAAKVSTAVLPKDTLAFLEGVCDASAAALNVAAGSSMPEKVRDTAVYPKAYCEQLLAGTVPSTTDKNTPGWLTSTIAALRTAATIAGIFLR